MAPGQQAAVGATYRHLRGSALLLHKRPAGQSGINSTVKTIARLLRDVLSRLHPGAIWRLLRGRGGLTGRRPRSGVPVAEVGLFYKSLRTDRETSQPNRISTEYWVSGLEPIYLEGALARAQGRLP
jgi:hypothetical protein